MKDRKGTRVTKMFGKEIKTPIDDTPPPRYRGEKTSQGDSYSAWGDEPFKQTFYSRESWLEDQRELDDLERNKGVKIANSKKTLETEKYWKPWREEFKKLLDGNEGHNITSAREEIRRRIEVAGSWRDNKHGKKGGYPDESTLKRNLKVKSLP